MQIEKSSAHKSKEEVVQEYRVQSIQEATMRVIARKGTNAATMQEIAEEAGVAKGTIYLYFRDRDELVEKTFETAIVQLHARVSAVLDTDVPFAQKFRAMLAAQLQFHREHREFFRMYISLRTSDGDRRRHAQKRPCDEHYQAYVARMVEVLRQAMDRGELRRLNPERLATFIIEGTIAVMIERVMEETPPPEADDVELIASALLDGITEREPGKRSTH